MSPKMMTAHAQLSAALAELHRMEAVVWSRNPEDALLQGRNALIPYHMNKEELAQWRSIKVTVAEIMRYI